MNQDFTAFHRLVTAVQPYLTDLVFVGGWAHRLMVEHPLALRPGFAPLFTLDADLAASGRLPRRNASLLELLEDAGFREELRGEDRPPVAEYHLGKEGHGFYTEFLTPLLGSGLRRDGQPDNTTSLAGVSASKLRYVDLLLESPWLVSVPGLDGLQVRICNPAAFIAQKLLITSQRKADKRAKDLLYVHDTALLFAERLDELSECWRGMETTPQLRQKVRESVQRLSSLSGPFSEASRIAQETGRADPPSATTMRARCEMALGIIFG